MWHADTLQNGLSAICNVLCDHYGVRVLAPAALHACVDPGVSGWYAFQRVWRCIRPEGNRRVILRVILGRVHFGADLGSDDLALRVHRSGGGKKKVKHAGTNSAEPERSPVTGDISLIPGNRCSRICHSPERAAFALAAGVSPQYGSANVR